jgi:hypothetical protein
MDKSLLEGIRRNVHRRMPIRDLVPAGTGPNETKVLVKQLADAVLVVTSRNEATGEEEVELAHEALILHWERLQAWLEDDLEALRLRESVSEAAREWSLNGKSEEYLQHRGKRLLSIRVNLANQSFTLNNLERNYLRCCEQRHRDISLDPHLHKVEEGGWGIIFSSTASPELREALAELRKLRSAQATHRHPERFKEFFGADGLRKGESVVNFFGRHGVDTAGSNPAKMPRFLLLVGGPDDIPFDFQYSLNVNYEVGRIYFDTLAEYSRYSTTVAAAENEGTSVLRKLTIFCPNHQLNAATSQVVREVAPRIISAITERHPDWISDAILGPKATKEVLMKQFLDGNVPAVLLTSGLGLSGTPNNLDERQGALICSDWDGESPPDSSTCFAASDVLPEARPFGMIAVFLSPFSVGTPEFSDFNIHGTPQRITSQDQLSALPIRLMGHDNGAALAIIGHIDTLWMASFTGLGQRDNFVDSGVYAELVSRLLQGYPVGTAMKCLTGRYTALSCLELEMRGASNVDLQSLRLAKADARNYVLLGDPAVRIVM